MNDKYKKVNYKVRKFKKEKREKDYGRKERNNRSNY